MPKTFRPITIIPPNLYVEREADRQLDRIVSDMGRPGYVLVARQMGKTNLLINMKRHREECGDKVIYLDLSNRFASLRNLFRHVIDTILESQNEVLGGVEQTIQMQRIGDKLEPNLEYDRHLRLILRHLNNTKLLIILDEVDSLISVDYSDTFFAQIRSMYFSRINYTDYERLSYILSGVAEPSDLIKDKNISPFNIGEKIYLDDFSESEFQSLIKKSRSDFDEEVVAEIYKWSRGNPRMTWDICSELEDVQASAGSLRVEDVKFAVEKLYLVRFDRPPIDHIRVLAEGDPEIRNAIVSLRWGKGDTLGDRTKSRLYLAGISALNGDKGPSFKNPIIDAALSDAWLNNVAVSQKGLREAASEHFVAGRYKEAIELLEIYRSETTADAPDEFAIYELGVAYYNLGKFPEAVDAFEEALIATESEDLIAALRYYIGLSYLKLGKTSESIPMLRQATAVRSEIRNAARLSLTSAIMAAGGKEAANEAIGVGKELIQDLSVRLEARGRDKDQNELLCSAHFNLYQAYRLLGEQEKSEASLDTALSIAPIPFNPALSYYKCRGSNNIDAKRTIIGKTVDGIIRNHIPLASKSAAQLDFTERNLSLILLRLIELELWDSLDQLVNYANQDLYFHSRKPFDVLLHLFRMNSDDRTILVPLIITAIDRFADESVTKINKRDALRMAVRVPGNPGNVKLLTAYISAVEQVAWNDIEDSFRDAVTLLTISYQLAGMGAYNEALHALHLSKKSPLLNESWMFRVIILNQEMEMELSLNHSREAKLAAIELLKALDSPEPNAESELEDETRENFKAFRMQAQRLIFVPLSESSIKLGRNNKITVRDRLTGDVVTKKFKIISDDLRSGRYEIVSIE